MLCRYKDIIKSEWVKASGSVYQVVEIIHFSEKNISGIILILDRKMNDKRCIFGEPESKIYRVSQDELNVMFEYLSETRLQ